MPKDVCSLALKITKLYPLRAWRFIPRVSQIQKQLCRFRETHTCRP